MNFRPRIGITVHSASVVAREGHEEVRFEVGARYAQAIAEAGGLPLLVPTHPSVGGRPEETLSAIDGLLLSGGGSLSASYFVEHPNPSLRDTNPPRYDAEVALVRAAAACGLPLLGVCRGHQTLVEALGGAIVNLAGVAGRRDHYQLEPPDCRTHRVTVLGDARLARLLPSQLAVNSFHRQAVSALPAGFRASAYAEDGTIEAVEAIAAGQRVAGDTVMASSAAPAASGTRWQAGWFAVGCQFHPEWLYPSEPGFLRLFEEFIAAAQRHSAERSPTR